MRARDQLVVAAVLAAATYFALRHVAEGKSEAAVGGAVFRPDARHREEAEALDRLRAQLVTMRDGDLARRLEQMQGRGELWIAPNLGPERWAVFVTALGLTRRIYVRREALLDPVAHLYRRPRPDIPADHQYAHATVGLAGALQHEVAHFDGVREEAPAYDAEIAWYEARRASGWLDTLPAEARGAWEWGIESAILSAKKARLSASGPSP